ncbi:MAG TPA: cupin domain-containing protein [Desulfitobacterium dehalogenans]|uniref:Cupin domain-containing protein n=1 Tax=Desulfitobacterium dehalogenans TaxID=36854 RepID=A0A7C6Z724_9FIRM|nr:cupin domain-containing protein [Desulfitobacterium dehalogenans]
MKFTKITEILSKNAKKTVLYESDCTNTAVINLQPGDSVPAHQHPNTDDIWVVIQGEGEFLGGKGVSLPMKAGTIIPNLKGEAHGIKNTGDEPLVVIAFSAPVPIETFPVD